MQKIITAAHWGVLKVTVENGRITQSELETPAAVENELATVVAEQVYSDIRVKSPMVRKGFLEQNPDKRLRGRDEWVAVSWQQALDLVHQHIQKVRCDFGAKAIFAGSYGWKSSGTLHSSRNLLHRYMNLTGGFTNSFSDYSTGAAQHILPHVIGSNGVYEQATSWDVILEHCDQIVLWGANPINTLRSTWTVTDQQGIAYFKKFQQSGKRILCIDPVRNESCDELQAEWVPIHTATDVPLMLGIAHTLVEENLHNIDFLEKYSVGYEKFEDYLLGKIDNQPKNAQWAAEICGVPAEQIRALAHSFSQQRTMLMGGWAMQRQRHGEQAPWMLVVLATMLGQIGLPGGGFGFSYASGNGGVNRRVGVGLGTISSLPQQADFKSEIPVSKLTDALLNPHKTIDFNGKTITYPEIQLIYWAGGNPLVHHQDTNQMVRAWQKPECIIVNEIYWTPTARMADIVLPTTTSFERNDLITSGSFSMEKLIPMKQVVPPQFDAKSDFDIFLELAQRAKVADEFSENKTEMEWLEQFYQQAKNTLKQSQTAVNLPDFSQFWAENQPFIFPEHPQYQDYVAYQKFRENPEQYPLATPSGKIEIFSETIHQMAYQDCLGHPSWLPPEEFAGKTTALYPLALVTPHSYHRLHSQLAYTSLREKYAVADREPVLIHTDDAKIRGITNSDIVRIKSPRGQVLAGAVVTDGIIKGTIALHEGAWFDPQDLGLDEIPLCKNGNPNVLTRDEETSRLAQGNSANTCIVQVEKWEGNAPKVSVFKAPKMG